MASPLAVVSLSAPGFLGLNTEQTAATLQERFATQLDNAVFDESGKIAARQGFSRLATGTPDTVDRVFMWRKDRTTTKMMTVGDASGTATLYEMTTTTTAYDTFTSRGTPNSTSVKMVNVNGYLCVFEQGQTPMVWDGTGSLANFAAATGTTANPTGGIAATAFGRLFVVSADGKTVHGSELQPDPKSTGINWDNWYIDTTGDSGASAKDGWTYGRDYIKGLAAIDDYLVIFGLDSILVFTDINGTVTLTDSITGVGCVNQDTIQHTGNDIIFLSATGVRSLSRTIRNETPELSDVSAFVRSDVISNISTSTASSVFDRTSGMYILSDGSNTYAFDTRADLPGGSMRASKWTLAFNSADADPDAGAWYMAQSASVGQYAGYDDDGSTYKFTIKSAWLDLGQQRLKIAKKLAAIIYAGDGYTPKFSWAFDWDEQGESIVYTDAIPTGPAGDEWNVAEWGIGEWSGVVQNKGAEQRIVQISGSGMFFRYGLEFTINGNPVGLHEIRFMAKLGRLAHV